jgi:hypothetical protein
LMAQRKHRNDGSYSDRSVMPVTEQNLRSFQDYPPTCRRVPVNGDTRHRPASAHTGGSTSAGPARDYLGTRWRWR